MQQLYPVLNFKDLTRDSIQALLQQHQLSLTPEEALLIQNQILKRPPTLAECHLWSIQGSEHCSYKSSRKYLKQLSTEAPHVISGAKEDAGIVAVATDNVGNRYGLVLSHESHNHPSQIVPLEGAATGVGGNMRDVCCMGAEVIAVGDGLRFGDLQQSRTHWIYEGVIAGIGGYGNASGIPNIAGDVYFDAAYNDNCLVTVVTLGIVAEKAVIHSFAPANAENHVYILVGKATDNSGFGGASFASQDLIADNHAKNKGAVQEPDAFLKRHLLKANYALFEILQEKNMIDKVGFKDLGAGGIACAAVELADAAGYGAALNMDDIPAGMDNLPAHVLLCSETQERFMWVVPPDLVALILKHYNEDYDLPSISHKACASVVGHIRTDGQFIVTAQGHTIIQAQASDITRGIQYDRPIEAKIIHREEPVLDNPDANVILLQLLSHENIASRQPILETYDKQVQGRTTIEAGEADAGLLVPFNEDKYPPEIQKTGIALSLDQNPRFNAIDPYWGAVNAVVEAVRNVAAVGATPLALSDCLCFGNPEKPQQMWEFTESIRGIVDACKAIGLADYPDISLPIIAGNVSFYNESQQQAIPPSPMIACVGSMPDAARAISSHFQKKDSVIILLGSRKNECGGSVYYQLHNVLGSQIPKPDLSTLAREIHTVTEAIQKGLVLSAHDISEGGIAVALAEMSFKNQIGVTVQIPGDLPVCTKLFTESGGFILEIAPQNKDAIKQLFNQKKLPFFEIGHTSDTPWLHMENSIDMALDIAKMHWENGLKEKLL